MTIKQLDDAGREEAIRIVDSLGMDAALSAEIQHIVIELVALRRVAYAVQEACERETEHGFGEIGYSVRAALRAAGREVK